MCGNLEIDRVLIVRGISVKFLSGNYPALLLEFLIVQESRFGICVEQRCAYVPRFLALYTEA